ncbi:tRNA (adenosine(37)-N6)-threonylcarbamoyltransferase complex ATPase subunit type 1 TsaE [soil metagenome]
MSIAIVSNSPDETFKAGEDLGVSLTAGDLVLLTGGLGAGKTLFTKGVMNAFGFEIDEVTSPSFTLVNLYRAHRSDVYHIDLWRLDQASNAAEAVGLDEILENPNAVTIIEWADRLAKFSAVNNTIRITIEGDGDEPRRIEIEGTSLAD